MTKTVEHDARRTVLTLMNAMGGTASVARLLRATDILGVEQGAVRMALTRLKSKKVLENPRRGVWSLSADGHSTRGYVDAWRIIQSRVMSWDEHSWVAYRASGSFQDTASGRARARTTRILGMRQWQHNLWVRPNNLVAEVVGLRARILAQADSQDDLVFLIQGLSQSDATTIRGLWDVSGLEAQYVSCVERMNAARSAAKEQSLDLAARNVYEVGDSVIRTLAIDPLLPADMIDTSLRAECIEVLRSFDVFGRHLWRQVLEE